MLGEEAKRRAAVGTGELRDSMRAEVDGTTLTLGSSDPVAVFVEYGARKMHARPFIAPTMEGNLGLIKALAEEELRKLG